MTNLTLYLISATQINICLMIFFVSKRLGKRLDIIRSNTEMLMMSSFLGNLEPKKRGAIIVNEYVSST
jgi:hypothetical protein